MKVKEIDCNTLMPKYTSSVQYICTCIYLIFLVNKIKINISFVNKELCFM